MKFKATHWRRSIRSLAINLYYLWGASKFLNVSISQQTSGKLMNKMWKHVESCSAFWLYKQNYTNNIKVIFEQVLSVRYTAMSFHCGLLDSWRQRNRYWHHVRYSWHKVRPYFSTYTSCTPGQNIGRNFSGIRGSTVVKISHRSRY